MAKPKYTSHLGMTDLLPGEVEQWQALERIIHETARLYHFHEIRTPILEPTELIARGIGQLTDIVSKEMFAFERHETNYVLRPECTAPVARAYIEHHLDQKGGTQQLYYMGPMFRAERPQKGRQRQFHQFGAEIMGTKDPVADADIIMLMMDIYQRVGITNTELKLNSVGDPESRERYRSALQEYFRPHLDKMSEVSRNRFDNNPMRILDSKEEQDQPFIEDAPVITDYLNEETSNHYTQVKEHLALLNIPYHEEPRLVRGLDYYTRTAFELISPDLGSQDALGGGGRYDLLVEELGGPPTPAVGFASGIERLFIACRELDINLTEEQGVDVYFVTRGEEARKWALQHLNDFRQQELSATMDYAGKSIKAQMKDANRQNARFAIIVGDDELQQQQFTLRNMQESDERVMSYDDLFTEIKEKR